MRFLSVFGVHLCPSLRYLLRHHADLLFLQTCCSYTMLVGIDGGTEANRYQVSASFQAAHVEHLITALGRHVALGRSASNARMPRFGPIELPAMRNSHVLDAGGTFSMLEIIDIATKGSFLVGNHNQNHGQNREFGRRCLVCIKIGKQLRIPGVSFSPLDRSVGVQCRHASRGYWHTSKSWNKKVGTQDVCRRGCRTTPGCAERETDSLPSLPTRQQHLQVARVWGNHTPCRQPHIAVREVRRQHQFVSVVCNVTGPFIFYGEAIC